MEGLRIIKAQSNGTDWVGLVLLGLGFNFIDMEMNFFFFFFRESDVNLTRNLRGDLNNPSQKAG